LSIWRTAALRIGNFHVKWECIGKPCLKENILKILFKSRNKFNKTGNANTDNHNKAWALRK